MKRIGTALVGVALGVALLLAILPGSQAGAAEASSSTTLTLTAGQDTTSAKPFTFQPGVAYDITVSGTITYNFTNSTPPTTCVHDTFYENCYQTGGQPGSWQRQDELEVFDDPHNPTTNSALPGSNTLTAAFNQNNTYSWVVPANSFANTTTKYFWANPWGQQEPYTTTYSGQITVTLTPHVQQNRFGVRFTVVGLPEDPPAWLQDVTLAGQGRIKLTSYSPDAGEDNPGSATGKLTEVEQVKLGSGPERRRKLTLTDAGGSATIKNFSGGGEGAELDGLEVTTSDDPHCEAGISTARVRVTDAPKSPDRVLVVLHCQSRHKQHTFEFLFVNSHHTHVTTAIVGPQ